MFNHLRHKFTLPILGLIMLVNALSYGTIIPLLYPYAARFGLTATGLSLLFASFSLAQFVATPIIGRLSDRFGRKPLLLLCLLGTGFSLSGFALSQVVWQLFISRILDGVTGGNISVAQAMIADTVAPAERPKAFGILGAAFGFGFLIGPALGGVLSSYGLSAPFWFAASLAFAGTPLGWLLLPETLSDRTRQAQASEPLVRPQALWQALRTPNIGVVLIITLLTITATNAWIISFQTFTVDELRLSPREIGSLFAVFGLLSIIMQGIGIRFLLRWIPSKRRILVASLFLATLSMGTFFLTTSFWPYLWATMFFNIAAAPTGAMLAGLLSERTRSEDQGAVMGINQAYTSLGQIFGPLLAAGFLALQIPILIIPFGLMLGATLVCRYLFLPTPVKVDL